MNINQVILGPVVTEKSTDQQTQGRYSFYVNPSATKVEIKQALKVLYGVDIAKVSVQKVRSKERVIGRGRTFKKRPDLKRAIAQTKDRKPLDVNKLIFKK